ncbi:MAG: tetratricopeptide repeat protein, partial [Bacteroidota bacterium]
FIFSGDPWEATLYYAQVEKANENNPTGHEAKFRKAKLAYYTGEFKWAQAQLDVLKASTSKLIANDAFELASLINDNTALDTTEAPLRLFSRADLLLYRNQDSLAVLTLDSIGILYPKHSLADEILYRKANICMKHQDYEQAAVYYREVIEGYSYDILADNSLFRLAGLYETKLDDMEKAKELYQRLITEFPGSIYVVDARKRFRILRGDKLKPASTEENFFRGISP